MGTEILIIIFVIIIAVLVKSVFPYIDKKSSKPDYTVKRHRGPAFKASHDQYQPYANVYGPNLESGDCAITITTPETISAIAIIKDAINGSVAGHVYIPRGCEETVCLNPGTYIGFFIAGTDWDSKKTFYGELIGAFRSEINCATLFEERTFTEGQEMKINIVYTYGLGNREVPLSDVL